MKTLRRFAAMTIRQARRVVVLIVGLTVVAVGIAMLVLPGPAVLVIPLGLGVLAIEFAWARRWLGHLRALARRQRYSLDANGSDVPRSSDESELPQERAGP